MTRHALFRLFFSTFLILSGAAFQANGRAFGAESSPRVEDAQRSIVDLKLDLGNALGEQARNVVENWVLRAPQSNPALLSVFELRDRAPDSASYYVPWVGEFAGKYLLSASQLGQMIETPELNALVDEFATVLIASQDADGYLGPFPREKRLTVGWDLWGHYHAIAALLDVYARRGNAEALACAQRAGDLICEKFGSGAIRPKDVGSDEMNLGALDALLRLYQISEEKRYLETAKIFLADLESCGDFYRLGLAGEEFYATPRPRWESLHTIVGLSTMAKVANDESYRRAFLNLYSSIRARDVHCNGTFSSGEQAVGSPWRSGAIETCCTVAWIATTVEALRASGDSRCADELENSLFNGVAAYEHPSGSWNAYDTPLNGRREASFQTIVFQARPGQPELNCCSVNGPRGLGELTNWALTQGVDSRGKTALYVNYYGSGKASFTLDGARFELVQKTNYPYDETVQIVVKSLSQDVASLPLKLRVPGWCDGATVSSAGATSLIPLTKGRYAEYDASFVDGIAEITLDFPMSTRVLACDDDFVGRAYVLRGPILLAYDQALAPFEVDALPTLAPNAASEACVVATSAKGGALAAREKSVGRYAPNLIVELPAFDSDGNKVALPLCDFASAGARGTSYCAALPASPRDVPPPTPICVAPKRGEAVPAGALFFARNRSKFDGEANATVLVSETPDFAAPILVLPMGDDSELMTSPEEGAKLKPNVDYFWKIVVENAAGRAESISEDRVFLIDPSLPPIDRGAYLARRAARKTTTVYVDDALAGAPAPRVGAIETTNDLQSAAGVDGQKNGSVAFNGVDSELVYRLEAFPAARYEATLEFALDALPSSGRIAELVSAWCKGMDDPLRIAVDDAGRLYAAVEGGRSNMSSRVPIEIGKWHTVRVVKEFETVSLYLDGEQVGDFQTNRVLSTDSLLVGLGCNPKYRAQSEFFAGRLARFRLEGVAEE